MFIVISYLQSGYNVVMGCVTEKWQSDLKLEEFETKEQAAEFIAQEEADQHKHRKYGEPFSRKYAIIEGECLIDHYVGAKEALDVLLKGSVI